MLAMGKRKPDSVPMFSPKQIKAIREGRGLTQADAAERVAVSQSVWSAWERGAVKPSRQSRLLIAQLKAGKI